MLVGKVELMSAKAIVDFEPDHDGAEGYTEICAKDGIVILQQ